MADAADVGLVGLAVMGQNLALNIADHGFRVAVYNRTTAKTRAFLDEFGSGPFGGSGGLVSAESAEELVRSIARPRRIILMVQAGRGTDAVIGSLLPLLEEGDCLVDGGNAHWEDTIRRESELTGRGILFVGSGVSGGEEGARFGPSLMPGGRAEAWELIEPIWTAIAAKVDARTGKPIEGAAPGKPVEGGEACSAWIGPGGAGHYVKMVHNGIEYGDMQMICEAYHLLRELGGLTPAECGEVFRGWNTGELDSFLIEITADILGQTDPETGAPFVEVVLDAAQQKGTGRWTSVNALDFGVPAPTITEAVIARQMSALKEERTAASEVLAGTGGELERAGVFGSKEELIDSVGRALYLAKICSYAQGFSLMRRASEHYGWGLSYGEIAMIWRGGCIIRARFLQKIKEAYDREPDLANLLLDPYFRDAVGESSGAWRRVVSAGVSAGVPMPAFVSALAYYDSYRCAVLPANLLQAQRDYFGAHTYERVDKPRGEKFHLDWPHPDRPQERV
mgnify:CR=1 FL=1